MESNEIEKTPGGSKKLTRNTLASNPASALAGVEHA